MMACALWDAVDPAEMVMVMMTGFCWLCCQCCRCIAADERDAWSDRISGQDVCDREGRVLSTSRQVQMMKEAAEHQHSFFHLRCGLVPQNRDHKSYAKEEVGPHQIMPPATRRDWRPVVQ